MPNSTNLATKTALNAFENKISKYLNILLKKFTVTQKLMKLKRKFLIIIIINTLLLQNLMS